jgi:tetratricopeptide (TPR) repeat protein
MNTRNAASRETCLATLEEIVSHVNQNSDSSSTCAGARALEHVADAFASKQAWAHAHETYSQALQMIKNTNISAAISNESTSSVQQSLSFNVLQKMAKVCMNLRDYDGAWKALQECLDIVKPASLPISDPSIVTVMNNMGHVQFAKGAIGKAIAIFTRCLTVQRSLVNRDLLAEADTMSKMGCISRHVGRFDAAIAWYEAAIVVRTEVLGEAHIGLSSDLLAIGNIHYRQRQFDHALAAFSECMSLHRSHPKSDLSLVVSILDKMGAICIQLDNRSNAADCYEEAVHIARSAGVDRTVGREPLSKIAASFARSLHNLALIHNAQGCINEAIDCAEEAFRILESSIAVRNATNNNATAVLAFLIRLYHRKGDAEKACKYSERISELEQYYNEGRPEKKSKCHGAPAA